MWCVPWGKAIRGGGKQHDKISPRCKLPCEKHSDHAKTRRMIESSKWVEGGGLREEAMLCADTGARKGINSKHLSNDDTLMTVSCVRACAAV